VSTADGTPRKNAGLRRGLPSFAWKAAVAQQDLAIVEPGNPLLWPLWRSRVAEAVRARSCATASPADTSPLVVLHSSGHTSVAALQRLAAAINAKEVIPVHTQQARRYGNLFAYVRTHLEGQWSPV
jgi:ribonuclease J